MTDLQKAIKRGNELRNECLSDAGNDNYHYTNERCADYVVYELLIILNRLEELEGIVEEADLRTDN